MESVKGSQEESGDSRKPVHEEMENGLVFLLVGEDKRREDAQSSSNSSRASEQQV